MVRNMNPFELKPLLVAAVIGAALMYLFDAVLNPTTCTTCATPTMTLLGTGAGIGVGVQIGVRLLGVS